MYCRACRTPPEENEWIQAVIDGLINNLNTVSEFNRIQYTGIIDYINENDLLRVVLNEIREEYCQRNAQGEH
jgi:CRISPR/Cas system-associated exonuclease Cas4 (RecB family)